MKKRKASVRDKRLQDRLNVYHQDQNFYKLFKVERTEQQALTVNENIIQLPLSGEGSSQEVPQISQFHELKQESKFQIH